MKSLFVIISLFISLTTFSQKQYNVLDWKADVSVNTFLVQKMHQQYNERRAVLEKALSSKQLLAAYIDNTRKKYLQVLGKLPERTSLNAKITGTIQQDGYTIEKIIYESTPHHRVTSNLYIPKGKGPFPAALLFCGHEDVSKATESYQKTAILFAKNGFVVFVIDPISQSERWQLTDANGKGLTRGGTTEHTLLNQASNLLGTSTPADELWDNERGLDYLVTRPEVDTARIGCLGNSGGGMQTIYFAGFDKRIKVIAPCSYLADRERTLEMTGPADGCAQMPGEGKAQLELDDYLIAAAPKPLLVLAGRYDFIDYSGALIASNELKKVYTALGQPQKFQLFSYDDGHGISQPKREAAVTWFRRWLCNDPTPIKEPDLKVLTDKELFCTKTGQVNTEYVDEIDIAKRNLQLFDEYKVKRTAFISQDKSIIRKKVAELLSLDLTNNNIDVEKKGLVVNNDGIVENLNTNPKKIIIRKKGEVPLPVLHKKSTQAIPSKIIIWLTERGKNAIADSVANYHTIPEGASIILCDLNGIGETADKPELNDAKFYNKEYRNAMLALHIGESMVGQRAAGILALMDFIASIPEYKNVPVEINATGIATLPALHAALLNDNIKSVKLFGGINSYKEILDHPLEKNWYSYVIPDVLEFYDIPDLVKLVGAERVKIIQ